MADSTTTLDQLSPSSANNELRVNETFDAASPATFFARHASTTTGLTYTIIHPGTGEPVKSGEKITAHYTGWLADGTKFDSSVDRDDPFVFVLGEGQVIAGWDQGVATMRVGDKVKLTIPHHLAYGEGGYPGAIPPRATLVFEVELLKA